MKARKQLFVQKCQKLNNLVEENVDCCGQTQKVDSSSPEEKNIPLSRLSQTFCISSQTFSLWDFEMKVTFEVVEAPTWE